MLSSGIQSFRSRPSSASESFGVEQTIHATAAASNQAFTRAISLDVIREGRLRAYARVTPSSRMATEARRVLQLRSRDLLRWLDSRSRRSAALPT